MVTFPAQELENHILDRMAKQKIPGLSLSLTSSEGMLYEKAFGTIDAAGTAVTPDTIFGIASLSKSLTGASLALLEYEGKLSLEDPVTRFFPDFRIPGTPKDAVLLHHLLNHTSGLPTLPLLEHSAAAFTTPDPWDEPLSEEYGPRIAAATIEDLIAYIREGSYTSLGQPGEYMCYCNEAYAILSAIVDRAADKPLEEFLLERIFAPLGMTRTALGYEQLQRFDNVTSLFGKKPDETPYVSDNWVFAPPYRGCGWVVSSSHDLVRYYLMLSQNGRYEGRVVLPPEVCDRLLGPHFPLQKQGCYTYGLNKSIMGEHILFQHTGGLKGISSAGAFWHQEGIAGACMTNIGGVDALRILSGAFNLLQGKPADRHIHNLTLSSGSPAEPWIYEGYFGGLEEGLPAVVNPIKVIREGGALAMYSVDPDEKRLLHFCGANQFMAAKEGEEPLRNGSSVRFYVHAGSAWAIGVGSRIYQRV